MKRSLRHSVGIFAAVFHCLECKAGTVHARVLRTLLRRHDRKFASEFHSVSLFNFRGLQCGSLRDGLNTCPTWRLIACRVAVRANSIEPPMLSRELRKIE